MYLGNPNFANYSKSEIFFEKNHKSTKVYLGNANFANYSKSQNFFEKNHKSTRVYLGNAIFVIILSPKKVYLGNTTFEAAPARRRPSATGSLGSRACPGDAPSRPKCQAGGGPRPRARMSVLIHVEVHFTSYKHGGELL